MGATPDELRGEVEARRAHLARQVDLLADKVTPGRIAHRKADATQQRLSSIKERVMGTTHDTTNTAHTLADSAGDKAARLGTTAKDAAAQAGDSIQQAPARLRNRTQGSPLAAGLVAFGAGLLAAALVPTSQVEKEAGAQVAEHADTILEPVRQSALDAVREVRDELREPASDAVEAVRSTAQDAAQTTKDTAVDAGQHTTHDLKVTGQGAVDDVREQTR